MKKIINLLMAVLFLISLVSVSLACTEEDGWQQCSGTKLKENWDDVPKTAENFRNLPASAKDTDKFDNLPADQKNEYYTTQANVGACPECDDDFFASSDLGATPESSNKYLQNKYGNSQVTFNVQSGMTFTDNPPTIHAPGVSAEGFIGPATPNTLTLKTGEGGGQIPIGTTSVSYDPAKGQYVFIGISITQAGEEQITRQIEVRGTSTSVQPDGTLLFEEDGEIVDTTTGSTISVPKGSKVKFDKDGFIIEGSAKGTWTDNQGNKHQIENFEGKTIIKPDLIQMDNGRVTLSGQVDDKGEPVLREVQGRVLVSGGGRRIVLQGLTGSDQLTLQDLLRQRTTTTDPEEKQELEQSIILLKRKAGSYKDNFGTVSGRSTIDFDEQFEWTSLTSSERVEFGSQTKENSRERQHLFEGEVKIDFNDDRTVSDAILQKDANYHDRSNEVTISAVDDTTTLSFGEFSDSAAKDQAQQSEKPIVFVNSDGKLVSGGRVLIETRGILYRGLQNEAVFTRTIKGDQELTTIESQKKGRVAAIKKKFTAGDLRQENGFVTDRELGISGEIHNIDGKSVFRLDKQSIQLRQLIERDPNLFALSETNLVMKTWDGSYITSDSKGGMLIRTADGKSLQIISPSKTHRLYGSDIKTISAIAYGGIKNREQTVSVNLNLLQKMYYMDPKDFYELYRDETIPLLQQRGEEGNGFKNIVDFLNTVQGSDVYRSRFIAENLIHSYTKGYDQLTPAVILAHSDEIQGYLQGAKLNIKEFKFVHNGQLINLMETKLTEEQLLQYLRGGFHNTIHGAAQYEYEVEGISVTERGNGIGNQIAESPEELRLRLDTYLRLIDLSRAIPKDEGLQTQTDKDRETDRLITSGFYNEPHEKNNVLRALLILEDLDQQGQHVDTGDTIRKVALMQQLSSNLASTGNNGDAVVASKQAEVMLFSMHQNLEQQLTRLRAGLTGVSEFTQTAIQQKIGTLEKQLQAISQVEESHKTQFEQHRIGEGLQSIKRSLLTREKTLQAVLDERKGFGAKIGDLSLTVTEDNAPLIALQSVFTGGLITDLTGGAIYSNHQEGQAFAEAMGEQDQTLLAGVDLFDRMNQAGYSGSDMDRFTSGQMSEAEMKQLAIKIAIQNAQKKQALVGRGINPYHKTPEQQSAEEQRNQLLALSTAGLPNHIIDYPNAAYITVDLEGNVIEEIESQTLNLNIVLTRSTSNEPTILIQPGQSIVDPNGKGFAISNQDMIEAINYLRQTMPQGQALLQEGNQYRGSLTRILGLEEVPASDEFLFTAERPLTIDLGLQDKLSNEQRNALALEVFESRSLGQIVKFTDESTSPGAIVLAAAGGAASGSIFSSQITGIGGAVLGVAENIVIDTATGAIIVGAGKVFGVEWDPVKHPVASAIIGAGIPLTTNVIKGAINHFKSAAKAGTSLDDLTRTLTRNLQLDDAASSQVAGALALVDVNDYDNIVRTLKNNLGHLDIDESVILKAYSDMEFDGVIARITDTELASLGLRRAGPATLVDETGRKVTNLEELNGVFVEAETLEAAKRQLLMARSRLSPDQLDLLRDADQYFNEGQIDNMEHLLDPDGYIKNARQTVLDTADQRIERIGELTKLDDLSLEQQIELENLRNTVIDPKTVQRYDELRVKVTLTDEEADWLVRIEERITLAGAFDATDPTEHTKIIQQHLGTGSLGHESVDFVGDASDNVQVIAAQLRRNQEQVILTYSGGIDTTGGSRIAITQSQQDNLVVMAETQNRLLQEAIKNGEIAQRARQLGISQQELVLRFNDQFADNLQRSLINDGISLQTPDSTITLGTGWVRGRESNGLDHAVGNIQRSLLTLEADDVQQLTALQKLEVVQAQVYHDMAKGAGINNAQAMSELGQYAEISKIHAAAGAKYIEDSQDAFRLLYGDEAYERMRYVVQNHDGTEILLVRPGKAGILDRQLNAVTVADNMAGTEVAFGTQIVSDKLVEAFQVPGNQQVLSKLFDVDDYAKPLGLDKTALVEKLKIDAIGNIRAATDLSDAQRIALIAVVDRDVSQYSMKFMRRTQAAGLFENARYEFTPGLAASGPGAAQQARKLVVDVRYSEIATELDNIHPGLKYDYVRGTTGTYWDRVTVAGPDTKTLTYGFDSLDDDAGVFILRENGAQEYLPGATRDEFVKTQLREMVTSEGYELDSAQKLVTDPDTGKVVADQVGFEIQIGCCSQATQHQLDNLEAAKIASTQTQTAEIVRIQQTTNQLAAKARAGTLDLIDIERQFEAAGFSVEIKDFHTLAGENLAAAIETTGQNLFKAQANNFENNIIAGIPENARRMAFQLIDN